MALYFTDVDDVVDPLDDFDAEDWTDEQLEAEQKRLKADADSLEDLISDLEVRVDEIMERWSVIDDELIEREEVSEESETPAAEVASAE